MQNDARTTRGGAGAPPIERPRDYHAYHDPESPAELTTTVAHALADVMGVDVTDAGFTLHEAVDPDALNRLFSDTADGEPRQPGHVAFSVEGYSVTVYSGGQIVITPPVGPA